MREDKEEAFFTVTTDDDVELDLEARRWCMAVADDELSILAQISGR